MLKILGRLRSVHARRRADDAGFTMIEVIVAMMVFAVIAICVASSMTNELVLTNTSRSREAAVNLASQDIDSMRMLALGSASGVFGVTSTSTPITYTVGGAKYSLARSVQWVTSTGGSGACGTGNGTLAYKSVVDTVSWTTGGGGTQSAKMSTLIAPISNINSDTAGTIIVSAIGAGGAPEPGLTVTVTPNTGGGGAALTTQPKVTDSDGCSFALNVTPGSYTVAASITGGIDYKQNAPASNSTVSVSAGQNTLVNFTYDLAGKFPLSYPSGATVATNMPVTFTNAVGGYPQFANAPTLVSAFPYPDGYRVIAGTYVYAAAGGPSTCIDTDPATWPTNPTTGAAPNPNKPVTVAPGGTAVSTAVPMGVVTLSGLFVGQWVTAVSATTLPAGSADPGCSATQTLTFPKAVGISQTLALPFGTWSLYTGATQGAQTTNFISAYPTSVTPVTSGSVDSTTTKTVTLDPRVVPSP